jgi:hypothetical protein
MSEILHEHTQICQAKSKQSGQRCKNYAIKGKLVCRFHGGKSTGSKTEEGRRRQKMASWKHGHYSKEAKEEYRFMREMIKESEDLIDCLRT